MAAKKESWRDATHRRCGEQLQAIHDCRIVGSYDKCPDVELADLRELEARCLRLHGAWLSRDDVLQQVRTAVKDILEKV